MKKLRVTWISDWGADGGQSTAITDIPAHPQIVETGGCLVFRSNGGEVYLVIPAGRLVSAVPAGAEN